MPLESVVKRSMIEVGFTVEKLAGPHGKEKCLGL
jgi:hypothetical protein